MQVCGASACMHSLDVVGKLMLGTQLLSEPVKTLCELGVDGQVPLTFVQTQELLRIKVAQDDVMQVVREV